MQWCTLEIFRVAIATPDFFGAKMDPWLKNIHVILLLRIKILKINYRII
jgi:hypothetical protein